MKKKHDKALKDFFKLLNNIQRAVIVLLYRNI